MYNESKAYSLLEEWRQYKDIHYSTKTSFDNAVNLEIEKDAVTRLSSMLREALMDNSCPIVELDFLTRAFETQLRIFKDKIMFELIRNGGKEEISPIR